MIFRVVATNQARLTGLDRGGYLGWTNGDTTGPCVIEVTRGLPDTNWVPYTELAVTGAVQTHRVVHFRPPPGMVYVPGGQYQCGDNYGNGLNPSLPVHTVTVSAIFMDRCEVTKRLWDAVRDWALTNGYADLNLGWSGAHHYQVTNVVVVTNPPPAVTNITTNTWIAGNADSNHPVVYLYWYDLIKWCNARSEKEGLTPVYYLSNDWVEVYRTNYYNLRNDQVRWTADGYRLPTETEWERAARGGLPGNHYPWPSYGTLYAAMLNGSLANYLNSGDPYEKGTTPAGYYDGFQVVTNPVGQQLPARDMANGYGLYDMAGNVWEWCWDAYLPTTYQWRVDNHDLVDPRGPNYQADWPYRCDRGGSFLTGTNNPLNLSTEIRYGWAPTQPASGNGPERGFRAVRRVTP